MKYGKEGTIYFESINILSTINHLWYVGDYECLEYGVGFSAINQQGEIVDNFNNKQIQYSIRKGHIRKRLS